LKKLITVTLLVLAVCTPAFGAVYSPENAWAEVLDDNGLTNVWQLADDKEYTEQQARDIVRALITATGYEETEPLPGSYKPLLYNEVVDVFKTYMRGVVFWDAPAKYVLVNDVVEGYGAGQMVLRDIRIGLRAVYDAAGIPLKDIRPTNSGGGGDGCNVAAGWYAFVLLLPLSLLRRR
jgi:hypothetical protein